MFCLLSSDNTNPPTSLPNTTANNPRAGLSSYTVNLEAQTADVYTDSVPFDTVLEKIKKTGKTVKGAEADGVGMGV